MKIIDNSISKIFCKDKSYSVLIYIDFDEVLTNEFILNYMNEILSKNSTLKQVVIEKYNTIWVENITIFNINDYYKIKKIKKEKFDDFIYVILNKEFKQELKWEFNWFIDEESNKTRLYFKIHHLYADGEKLLSILLSPFENYNNNNKFKRKVTFMKTIYYYIIGTIILLLSNIKIIINLFIKTLFNLENINDFSIKDNITTDYIIFKKLNLNKIKKFVKNNNITINDFLYSLMIKTDKLYRKKEKKILTGSPIYTYGKSNFINVCPIFNEINNSHDNKKLFKLVNNTFNYFKYSFFVPILTFIINTNIEYTNLDFVLYFYKYFENNVDYLFTNVVGPPINCCNVKITNIHFLLTAKRNEIIYNIISSGNNINIICSFKKGIIKNKKKFKKYVYKAYNNLINNSL